MKKFTSIICLCFVAAAAFAQGNFNDIRLSAIAATCGWPTNLWATNTAAGIKAAGGDTNAPGAYDLTGVGAAAATAVQTALALTNTATLTTATNLAAVERSALIATNSTMLATNGNAQFLTNFTGLTFTNTTTFITQGGTVTAGANGDVYVNIMVTNAQLVVLTNRTSHQVRWMGTRTGASTNTDSCWMRVHSGDSITLTNWAGAGGATLLFNEFDVLK